MSEESCANPLTFSWPTLQFFLLFNFYSFWKNMIILWHLKKSLGNFVNLKQNAWSIKLNYMIKYDLRRNMLSQNRKKVILDPERWSGSDQIRICSWQVHSLNAKILRIMLNCFVAFDQMWTIECAVAWWFAHFTRA